MTYIMAIAIICGSRFENTSGFLGANKRDECAEQLLSCYESKKGEQDSRLIKCIREGK